MKASSNTLEWFAMAGIAGLAFHANAASITQADWDFLHSQNNSNISGWVTANGSSTEHDISVFAGSSGYAGWDATGAATSGTFGDGTVTAYNFWTADMGLAGAGDESMYSYAESGDRITGDTTDTNLTLAGATDLWTATDPAGFTSTANYFDKRPS